ELRCVGDRGDAGGRAAGVAGGKPGGGGGGGGAPAAPPGRGLPLMHPPYGQLSAINMKTGEIIWQVPHGDTPDNVRNNPALKGVNIPRTGRGGAAITLVTKSLVIAGERSMVTMADGRTGAMLRAYQKPPGQDVGAVYLAAPATG